MPEGDVVLDAVTEPDAVALAEARSVSVPVGLPDAGGDTERDGVAGGLDDSDGAEDADAIAVAVTEGGAPGDSVAVTDGVGVSGARAAV